MILLEDVAEYVLRFAEKKRKTWFTAEEFYEFYRRQASFDGSFFTLHKKLEAMARKGLLRKTKIPKQQVHGLRTYKTIYYINTKTIRYWLKQRRRL